MSYREECLRTIANAIDYPSVYMGGPSKQSLKTAERVLSNLIEKLEQPSNEMVLDAVDAWHDCKSLSLDDQITASHKAMLQPLKGSK